MKGFDRLFLFLFSLAFIVVSIFVLLVGIGFFNEVIIDDIITLIYSNSDVKLSLILISGVIILFGLYFLAKSVQTKQLPSFTNKPSEIGDIRISMDTLETLALKVTSKVNGVKEQKVKVRLEDDKTVTAVIKINVDGETSIPEISSDIQHSVKSNFEQIAGVEVGNVHVVVSNVGQASNKKSRSE